MRSVPQSTEPADPTVDPVALAQLDGWAERYRPRADWGGGPLANLANIGGAQFGHLMEAWVLQWCPNALPCPDSEADIILGGLRVEIKAARLSAYRQTGARYSWGRVNPGYAWDALLLVGVTPHRINCWSLHRREIDWQRWRQVKGTGHYMLVRTPGSMRKWASGPSLVSAEDHLCSGP